MILESGSKILVAHRRLFESDHGRYFLARVDAYEAGVARITGSTWIRDQYLGNFQRKFGETTKLISLSSGSLIVYALPDAVDLSAIEFSHDGKALTIQDGNGFVMDLSESLVALSDSDTPRSRPNLNEI